MDGFRWTQVPPDVGNDPPRSRVASLGAVAALALAVPAVDAAMYAPKALFDVVVIALVAAAVTVTAPALLSMPVAVVAGATAYVVTDHRAALALAVGLVVGRWTTMGQAPLPRLPAATRDTLPPVAVLVATSAAITVFEGSADWRFAIPLALAPAIPLLHRLGGGAVPRMLRTFGRRVGTAVASVLFLGLSVPAVAIPWCWQRLFRLDPLAPSGRWTGRARRDPRPRSLWAAAAPVSPGDGRRVRGLVGGVAVVVLLVWTSPDIRSRIVAFAERSEEAGRGFVRSRRTDSLAKQMRTRIKYAAPPGTRSYEVGPDRQFASLVDSPWFHTGEYSGAQGWAFEPSVAWRPVNPFRMLDFYSTWVNVVDGRRAVWTPPACTCRRVTVWMYGGSTTWGLDQRDEHTIASELARVAHEHGLTVDVQNRGQLGHLHWMEAEKFAWDLTVDPPPDLALFYDGVNDTWAANSTQVRSWGEPLLDPTTNDVWESSRRNRGTVDGPPGSRLVRQRSDDDKNDLAWLPRRTVSMYDATRALSRTTAERHGVEVRYVWQPTRFDRPFEPSEPHGNADVENSSRLSQQLMREFLPDDVIDVSESLAPVKGALFSDDVHHNERGARAVAEAIFDRIQNDLRAIQEEGASR